MIPFELCLVLMVITWAVTYRVCYDRTVVKPQLPEPEEQRWNEILCRRRKVYDVHRIEFGSGKVWFEVRDQDGNRISYKRKDVFDTIEDAIAAREHWIKYIADHTIVTDLIIR